MYSSQLSPLLIPPDDVGTTAVPDQVPEVPRLDENVQLSTATDKNKSDQRSTASTAAGLLEGVRDGPLKSVAGGLHFIVRVRLPWVIYSHPTVEGQPLPLNVYPPVMLHTLGLGDSSAPVLPSKLP